MQRLLIKKFLGKQIHGISVNVSGQIEYKFRDIGPRNFDIIRVIYCRKNIVLLPHKAILHYKAASIENQKSP